MTTTITEAELKKINDERRRKNLPRLTLSQAQQIVVAQTTITPDFDITSFLIGFVTGHGGFSVEGQLGAALHPEPNRYEPSVGPNSQTVDFPDKVSTEPAPAPAPEPSPSVPDPTPSYDSSSSAASYTDSNGGNI